MVRSALPAVAPRSGEVATVTTASGRRDVATRSVSTSGASAKRNAKVVVSAGSPPSAVRCGAKSVKASVASSGGENVSNRSAGRAGGAVP